jgi:uncharacterized DUF497 family protein
MMEREGIFEWDSNKAKSNLAKHDVTFAEAKDAFLDSNALEIYDHLHAKYEHRFTLTGFTGYRLLFVVFKELPAGRVRIISAREAEKDERDDYEKNLLQSF